ncbi:MAG: hypothetical protein AB1Z16_08010, partial [Desulfotignum sp.]
SGSRMPWQKLNLVNNTSIQINIVRKRPPFRGRSSILVHQEWRAATDWRYPDNPDDLGLKDL